MTSQLDIQKTRHKLLSAAAFGDHFSLTKILAGYFDKHFQHSAFFFYDYFLDRPIVAWSDENHELKRAREISAPFLARIAREGKFVPKVDDEVIAELRQDIADRIALATKAGKPSPPPHFPGLEIVPFTSFVAAQTGTPLYTMPGTLADSDVLKYLYLSWNACNNPALLKTPINVTLDGPFTNSEPSFSERSFHRDGIISFSADVQLDQCRHEYPCAVLKDGIKTDVAVAVLREYGLVMNPWLRSKKSPKVKMIGVSVSSNAIFWGECILYFLEPPTSENSKSALQGLLDLIRQHIAQTYVPMLTLFENYLCERDLQHKFRSDKTPSCDLATLIPALHFSGIYDHTLAPNWIQQNEEALKRIALGRHEVVTTHPPSSRPIRLSTRSIEHYDNVFFSLLWWSIRQPEARDILSFLERSLMEIWADRIVWLFKNKTKKPVEDSLVFAKYLVGSPTMTRWVLEAAKVRHEREGEFEPNEKKRRVRTTLVVGGPGSGKDSMAELIALFSPAFRLGAMEKMNMAMFRPKEAAVPLLLGAEIQVGGSPYTLTGTLERALIEHKKELASAVTTDAAYGTRGSTFVFDELNSLDIDTQGALLRFIENADLKRLGGLKHPMDSFDVLIVGVMNEDPQVITKRRAMDGVLRDKLVFGGMLGEFLYETFRAQRRLRDDLYFRFIRGGEILLPELRDRREDIPVLFYVSADDLLRQRGIDDWEIDLSAYEELMDRSLRWEGNLRELQTVARQTVANANEDFMQRRRMDAKAPFLIMGIHVRHALDETHRELGVKR